VFITGLDLGQLTDPTALAILEQTQRPSRAANATPGMLESCYAVRYMHRFPLGTPYTRRLDKPAEMPIVEQVVSLFRRPELEGTTLVIDRTGVGVAGVDIFKGVVINAWIRPVTITGGNKVTEDPDVGGFNVPKKDLATTINILFQQRRIIIVPGLKDGEILKKELANFKVKISPAGNELYEAWRKGEHDDLVLAIAIAAWVGENTCATWDGSVGQSEKDMVSRLPGGVFNPQGQEQRYDYWGNKVPELPGGGGLVFPEF
jgi:hypothetical protein